MADGLAGRGYRHELAGIPERDVDPRRAASIHPAGRRPRAHPARRVGPAGHGVGDHPGVCDQPVSVQPVPPDRRARAAGARLPPAERRPGGVVEADYRFTGAARQTWNQNIRFRQGFCTCFGAREDAEPVRRTEYYSPGPIQWQRETGSERTGTDGPTMITPWAEYAPHRTTEFHAVMGPSFATVDPARAAWVFREGDAMDVRLPMLTDAGPGRYHSPTSGQRGTRGSTATAS